MTVDREPDNECRSTLEDLWSTPVGRRWVLKAGLGSAVAAMTAGLYRGPARAAAATRPRADTASVDLQFALGSGDQLSDLVLVANGQRVALQPHTAASLAALQDRGGLWGEIDLSALTHQVTGVELPSERALMISVHGRRDEDDIVVAQMWHVPGHAIEALARTDDRLTGSLKDVRVAPAQLKALGASPNALRSANDLAQLATIGDSFSTAVAITMLHPNVATVDPTAAAATHALLGQTPAVTALGSRIGQMQKSGKDFAKVVTVTDADGSPSKIKLGDTTTTFQTVVLSDDAAFKQALKASVSDGVVGVRDTASLGAVIDKPLDEEPSAASKTWVVSDGVKPQAQAYSAAPQAASQLGIKVRDGSYAFGTKTVVNGGYDHGKVPLRLYNNWVRWVWVYVQYLGKDGANLSLDPTAKWPDTKYARSLGLLPQVFTVLGVPLWDTNTIDVTVDFPEGAHTARLLFCGLGSDIHGGGWRQYFPADAYPDRVAPTDEVIVAALITGIFTIGLTVFALATDLDIAATWQTIRKDFNHELELTLEEYQTLLSQYLALTASEATATAVAAGGATYADISSNGGSTSNIWSILLNLATVIPKVIFNPRTIQYFGEIGLQTISLETAAKLEEAIPVIGLALGIIEALGDVATLAEICAETTVAPWVIENEVTVTYQATVMVQHDPDDATFPVTAHSWRLEALVDGALTLDPITGSINVGGKTRSDPLVLNVTAPFGGKQIAWSIVMLDAAGRQVGTGVSPQYPNDNPAAPPGDVPITITELPAAVTSTTVFKRADTTAYSTADGGYTWSDQVTDSGTNLRAQIQQVTGVAIATLAGVAGVVFKQGDRYYVRGVPIAENASTIELGRTQTEGYARRPFLLLDSFVAKADRGNHVLLEPDDTTDAYHIRRVTLDPVSGAISWDSSASYGTFLLPVSAAALHASGRVVALHTDSGRFGWLQPVDTPRPQLAAYSAGPGTQTGLLSSPIAVTVTNPGVVLVLEAGASQVAAFDLNGNPVRYFKPGGESDDAAQYTLALVSKGTYLDLSVDGSGQIYVLYYTSDGSTPDDYRVDVYEQSGAVLDTRSPGVNVPRLAVDYWRSIYAANFNALADLGTSTAHVDPALKVTEPSLSRFDPTEPGLRASPSPRRTVPKHHEHKHHKRHPR